MATENETAKVADTKEKKEKTKKEVKEEKKTIFPLSTEALDVLSRLYTMTETEEAGMSARDREIRDRPMLFLAQKLCDEFGVLTIDLIKYIAVLDGLDIKVDHDNWIIKIEGDVYER